MRGNLDATWGLDRVNTGAGKYLQIVAGDSQLSGTNLDGGELRLSSGISTGTGTSKLSFYTASAGVS